MTEASPLRAASLHVLFAREAPLAVILRRGPSQQVRLILWRTDTDTFEPGQWLKGRIYEGKADLSPDGQLFSYFATDWRYPRRRPNGPPAWVAVSRPPYLTALVLWPMSSTWEGDTAFLENRILLAHGIRAATPEYDPPLRLQVKATAWGERWTFDPVQNRRARLSHLGRTIGQELPEADFVDVDQSGRLVFTQGGRLLVRTQPSDPATQTELADFTEMTFEPIASPEWAKQWP